MASARQWAIQFSSRKFSDDFRNAVVERLDARIWDLAAVKTCVTELVQMEVALENHLVKPLSPPAIDHSSKMRTNVERNQLLDVWRGVACLMVFAFHTGATFRWPPFAFYGNNGVHLFFVLSGYLIFQPYLRSMSGTRPFPSIGRFYARRFLRIYPPYAVSLIAFIALRYATRTNVPSAHNILLHALMSFNYITHINFFSINPVFWSLAIEAQFYLILPLACIGATLLVGRRQPQKQSAALLVVAGFLTVGLAFRTLENSFRVDDIDAHIRTVFSYLDLFGWGMLVTCVEERCRLAGWSFPRWLLACLGVIIVLATNSWALYAADGNWLVTSNLRYAVISPALICAGASLILLAVVQTSSIPQPIGKLLRPLVWTGEISYSIYLYHVGVQFAAFKFVHLQSLPYTTQAILYSLIALPPTLLLSWLMYLLIERPSLKMSASLKGSKGAGNFGEASRSEILEPAVAVV